MTTQKKKCIILNVSYAFCLTRREKLNGLVPNSNRSQTKPSAKFLQIENEYVYRNYFIGSPHQQL